MKFSLIIPCYNEQDVILKTYDETIEALKEMEEDYEIIFVNDGSKDNTLHILKELASKDNKIKIIDFSRNFGQQAALSAGLDYADGDYIGFIDADLQDPPKLLLKMLEKIKTEGYDVVYGTRNKREGESDFKKSSASLYYKLLNSFSEVEMPENTSDFRVMTKQVANEVRNLKEKNKYLRGIVSWVGFKQGAVYFDRPGRCAGETKYSLKKLFQLAIDGMFSFSYIPSKTAIVFTGFFFLLGFLGGGGRFSTYLMGLSILFSIWILTEYAHRILDEARNRPVYIIKEKINFS